MGYSLNQKEIRARMAEQYKAEMETRDPATTPARTFVNSTTTGLYTGNNMQSARADANQHLQYANSGYQPQIRRV